MTTERSDEHASLSADSNEGAELELDNYKWQDNRLPEFRWSEAPRRPAPERIILWLCVVGAALVLALLASHVV